MKQKNPFRVLGVSTRSTNEEIVHAGKLLSSSSCSESEKQEIRFAMTELMTDPVRRARHECFEFPGTQYQDEMWEVFISDYKNHLRRSDTRKPYTEKTILTTLFTQIQQYHPHNQEDIQIIIRNLLNSLSEIRNHGG